MMLIPLSVLMAAMALAGAQQVQVPSNMASFCGYYKIFEDRYKCGDKGYPINYGKRFCELFDLYMPEFNTTGQTFANCFRQCLVNFIYARTFPNCQQLEEAAFDSHTDCFLNCPAGLGMCNIIRDEKNINAFKMIFEPRDLKSVQGLMQIIKAIGKCAIPSPITFGPIVGNFTKILEDFFTKLSLTGAMEPRKGLEFDEAFARDKMLPLAAGAYALEKHMVGMCTQKASASLRQQYSQGLLSGYTAVSTDEKAIIAAFRGVDNPISLIKGLAGVLVTEPKKAFEAGGKVEAYFMDSFYSIWNNSMRDDLLALKKENPGFQLWVTGHSLGGAMASLAAAVAVETNMFPTHYVKLVTFGQPRTGDMKFAEAHDRLVPYSFRLINKKDPIPHLPMKVSDIVHGVTNAASSLLGGTAGQIAGVVDQLAEKATPLIDKEADSPFHHRYEIWYKDGMPGKYQQCLQDDDSSKCSTPLAMSLTDMAMAVANPVGEIKERLMNHIEYYDKQVPVYGVSGCLLDKTADLPF